MKNAHRLLRPIWTSLHRLEFWLIFVVSIGIGFYAGYGQQLATSVLGSLDVKSDSVQKAWPLVDVIVVTAGCVLAIQCYKRLAIGLYYPCTFIYYFNLPEESSPFGRIEVVGFCCVRPKLERGELSAVGTSFKWENGLLGPVEDKFTAAFTSHLVVGKAARNESIIEFERTCQILIERTCLIMFSINEKDRGKRLYSYGFLEFEFVKRNGETDTYAGVLRSARKDPKLPDTVGVFAKGYAERLCRGECTIDNVRDALKVSGQSLFNRFVALLGESKEPGIWRYARSFSEMKKNVWQIAIPTPQSVMLAGADTELGKAVRGYLNNVLRCRGLAEDAIGSVVKLAVRQAMQNQDDTSKAFEGELKALLARHDKTPGDCDWDAALTDRADKVCKAVSPYIRGESLLDIGCGDGRISSLIVRQHTKFRRKVLVDVVEYVPEGLRRSNDLIYMPYEEGRSLPTGDERFDTVLLLTVLHHADKPIDLLSRAWAATKQRLIIIESVVGVRLDDSQSLGLNDDGQIAFAAFVDWFFNRVLHDGVPVPCNFTSVEAWGETFKRSGMNLIKEDFLGRDIIIGPEYHVLFVLEKPVSQEVASLPHAG